VARDSFSQSRAFGAEPKAHMRDRLVLGVANSAHPSGADAAHNVLRGRLPSHGLFRRSAAFDDGCGGQTLGMTMLPLHVGGGGDQPQPRDDRRTPMRVSLATAWRSAASAHAGACCLWGATFARSGPAPLAPSSSSPPSTVRSQGPSSPYSAAVAPPAFSRGTARVTRRPRFRLHRQRRTRPGRAQLTVQLPQGDDEGDLE
jgi:hypothetical protein